MFQEIVLLQELPLIKIQYLVTEEEQEVVEVNHKTMGEETSKEETDKYCRNVLKEHDFKCSSPTLVVNNFTSEIVAINE